MGKTLKFIDLFAGLGGFHLALTQLGSRIGKDFVCVFASELKEDLRKLYLLNFPGTKIEGDITKVSPSDIPAHDIVCAGFPCQPFSQAGKRLGFDDENRGNLFYYICEIIKFHKPEFVFLENVSNLLGHDKGNTWDVIYRTLDSLGYDVKKEILSPHSFGISQHRRRIYIVGRNRDYGTLDYFKFPKPSKVAESKCNINSIIDLSDSNVTPLKEETRFQLQMWQKFIDELVKRNIPIPQFPIWAMEFGATYDFEDVAPAYQTLSQLQGKRGKLGQLIKANTVQECLALLPNYAQSPKSKQFPNWKIRYIQQNREFYKENSDWLDLWLKEVASFENSHLKLEWNCGKDATPILEDKIIQFRASGIRVKLPTFSPALNLVGTQTPIFPWVPLPKNLIVDGGPTKGRYMTIKEAAAIQGMQTLFNGCDTMTFPLTRTRVYEALGNAVNVTLVKHIAINLFSHE